MQHVYYRVSIAVMLLIGFSHRVYTHDLSNVDANINYVLAYLQDDDSMRNHYINKAIRFGFASHAVGGDDALLREYFKQTTTECCTLAVKISRIKQRTAIQHKWIISAVGTVLGLLIFYSGYGTSKASKKSKKTWRPYIGSLMCIVSVGLACHTYLSYDDRDL